MGQSFFSGASFGRLDDKGRFVLPQEMRYGFVENGKCEFVLGLGLGGCIAVYRTRAIHAIVEKFREKQHVAQYQKFFTLFFSTLHPAECDKLGRVAIPAALKSAAGIQKEIAIAGVLDKVEIWPKEVYEKDLRALMNNNHEDSDLARMTQEAFALLATESRSAPESSKSTNAVANWLRSGETANHP